MKRKEVEISARMKALTNLVTPGRIVCDIGCDHGFVSIYLVQKGISDKVFAMDVRSGPLSRAQTHIIEYGLEKAIETRLSDGLQKLEKGEADSMICAGMGGPLMIKILQEGREKAHSMKELILQPQSEIAEFRRYLRTSGYHIIKEDMVYEDGKYYPMMKVVPEEQPEIGTGSSIEYPEESEGAGALDIASVADVTGTADAADAVDAAGVTVEVVSVELEECEKQRRMQKVFDLFGQYLLEHKHPILKQYLKYSVNVMETLQKKLKEQKGERALARLPEVETELELIRIALKYFED